MEPQLRNGHSQHYNFKCVGDIARDVDSSQDYCEGDKGMPKGWLYVWEGMATMGRQNLETRFGRNFLSSI
jgi:hypothetical protein